VIRGSEGQNGTMNKPMGSQVALKGTDLSVKEKKKHKMKGSGKK
jgi:hypothetical protein